MCVPQEEVPEGEGRPGHRITASVVQRVSKQEEEKMSPEQREGPAQKTSSKRTGPSAAALPPVMLDLLYVFLPTVLSLEQSYVQVSRGQRQRVVVVVLVEQGQWGGDWSVGLSARRGSIGESRCEELRPLSEIKAGSADVSHDHRLRSEIRDRSTN
uniref:Uncharacterized protein n=1 Tax=Knipowitschia caucasica TaxID=637954 RepID=A0AAV2JHK2_KNICA